jgi:hypothetical protein
MSASKMWVYGPPWGEKCARERVIRIAGCLRLYHQGDNNPGDS